MNLFSLFSCNLGCFDHLAIANLKTVHSSDSFVNLILRFEHAKAENFLVCLCYGGHLLVVYLFDVLLWTPIVYN